MKLSKKQQLFCREYISDFNASRAAIDAGYSKKTARTIGSNLLTKVNIQAYIKELMKIREQRTEVTADRVIAEFAKIAFNSDAQLYDAAFEVDVKDKLKALEALAKHTGAFNKDESEKTSVHIDISKWIS